MKKENMPRTLPLYRIATALLFRCPGLNHKSSNVQRFSEGSSVAGAIYLPNSPLLPGQGRCPFGNPQHTTRFGLGFDFQLPSYQLIQLPSS
jgi:hypothetical protein